MKIVLVFPPFYLEGMYNLPPLGLINLATSLKPAGHEIHVMDFVLAIRNHTLAMGSGIYQDCAERILEKSPSLVGFSAQCTTYPAVIQISKRIKAQEPGVKIVIGGHNASFVDRITLERYPFVDVVVRGEGEVTLKELTEALDSGMSPAAVAGVTWRRDDRVVRNEERRLITDLNQLPLPDYAFLPSFSQYRDACRIPRSIAILEVGRGCPHRCIYCSESILWRRKARTFSVSRLVREMENLSRNFGAECFLLAYDQFTSKRSFVESFCRRVMDAGLNHLPWYCISRLDSVDTSLLKLMKEAGCESMCYGIDSGSERTLAFIRKDVDQGILYERVAETAEQGMIPTLSFVIGFPEEKKEDIDKTLLLALRAGIVGNNNPLIQLPTVLPGTELQARYQDRLVREVDTYFALGLEFDEGKRLPSDEALIDSEPLLFGSFYNLPCPARSLRELNLIASYFPLMVRFYPKTFLLLALEGHKSISDLFIRWLVWLKECLARAEETLSPQDCYLHFRAFTRELLEKMEDQHASHLPEILKYENLALEVAKFVTDNRPFHVDLQKIGDFRPRKSGRIIVEAFDFNIPMIILDFKAGNFAGTYEPQETFLIFRQEDDFLDVSEVNGFVRDLLELSNGEKTLESISHMLYHRYGQGMKPETFFETCVEAIQLLGNERFLESRGTESPRERR